MPARYIRPPQFSDAALGTEAQQIVSEASGAIQTYINEGLGEIEKSIREDMEQTEKEFTDRFEELRTEQEKALSEIKTSIDTLKDFRDGLKVLEANALGPKLDELLINMKTAQKQLNERFQKIGSLGVKTAERLVKGVF